MVANSIPGSRIAFWGVWVLAGTVGSLVPVLPAALDLRLPLVIGLGLDDAYALSTIVLGATCLAVFQTIVMGAVRGRFSASVLAWIPVSTGATFVAYLLIALWQGTIPRTVISVGAIQASLPSGFPLLQVIFALFGIAVAVVVGLAQGFLLARIFQRRSAVALWLIANLVGALLVGIVFGIRLQEPTTGDNAALTAIFLSNTLVDGAFYAAVTGAALIVIAERKQKPAGTA